MEDRPLGAESSLTDSLGARIADQLHNEGSEGAGWSVFQMVTKDPRVLEIRDQMSWF